MPKGLCIKGRNYHFRKRVPKGIQNQIGKKEIWRSLRTDSLQTALRRLPSLSAQVESELERARKEAGLGFDETLLEPFKDDERRSGASGDEKALTLEAAYDLYLSDPTHNWSIRTRSSYSTSRNLAIAVIGREMPLTDLSRSHCRGYLELLRHLPRNAAKRLPKLTPAKAAEKAMADSSIETISAANANVYLADFSTFLNWAVNEELITHNPIRGLRLPDKVAKRDKRLPFSADQLQKIFNAPLYTGCQDGERGYAKIGHEKPHNARFWVPLIALHTGMRLNEICQLDVTDIQVIEGINCTVVTETSLVGSTDKKLKTRSSNRVIPLHSNLLELGLPQFAAQRRGEGHTKLFHEIDTGKNGIRSIAFSKWFTQFLRKCGANRPKTCFHSFRHNFRDELRFSRVNDSIAIALGGWTYPSAAKGNVSEHYGCGHSIQVLSEAIHVLSFTDVKLAHLYDH